MMSVEERTRRTMATYLEVGINAYCSLANIADLALVRNRFAAFRHCSTTLLSLSRICRNVSSSDSHANSFGSESLAVDTVEWDIRPGNSAAKYENPNAINQSCLLLVLYIKEEHGDKQHSLISASISLYFVRRIVHRSRNLLARFRAFSRISSVRISFQLSV